MVRCKKEDSRRRGFENGRRVLAFQFDKADPGCFRRLLIVKRSESRFKRERRQFVITVQTINQLRTPRGERRILLTIAPRFWPPMAVRSQNSGGRLGLPSGLCNVFPFK